MRAPGSLLAVAVLATIAGCSGDGTSPYFPAASPFDVVETVPANGATGVPVTSTIEIEFGGDVDSTAARSAIHVVATGDTVDLCEPNNTTYSNRVLICDPLVILSANQPYTVTLDPGIPDSSGRPLGGEIFTFTTRTAPAPAVVTARAPTPGRTDVPVNFLVRVAFSEALAAPIPTNVLRVEYQAGGVFNGLTSYDAASKSLVFRPGPIINATRDQTMVVTLTTTDLRDVNGNVPVSIPAWDFDITNANPGEDVDKPLLSGPMPVPAETRPPPLELSTVLLDPPDATDPPDWPPEDILYEGFLSRLPLSDSFGPCDDPFEPLTQRVGVFGPGAVLAFPGVENGQWEIVLEAEDGSGRRSAPLVSGGFGVLSRRVLFQMDIKPMLVEDCGLQGCHRGEDATGGLDLHTDTGANPFERERLTTRESTFEGLSYVQPFCLEKSYLWRKVRPGYEIDGGNMPPVHAGVNALGRSEIDLIRRWIEQGAN